MLNKNDESMRQNYFNYILNPNLTYEYYFVGNANKQAYDFLITANNTNNKFFLYGPNKSGKTHLGLIWTKKNNAIIYNNDLQEMLDLKKNIFIDNVFNNIDEENIFHLLNHCYLNNLGILITSNKFLNQYNFKFPDLSSRLKSLMNLQINLPDDELLVNLMVKLFNDKQIIVKNDEIFNFIIKRAQRSFEKIYILIEKIDNLSLEKNKQLTIPLIKEIL